VRRSSSGTIRAINGRWPALVLRNSNGGSVLATGLKNVTGNDTLAGPPTRVSSEEAGATGSCSAPESGRRYAAKPRRARRLHRARRSHAAFDDLTRQSNRLSGMPLRTLELPRAELSELHATENRGGRRAGMFIRYPWRRSQDSNTRFLEALRHPNV
jgi:hypothetical protein